MAVIATQVPKEVADGWRNRARNPEALDHELDRWEPVIDIGFNESDIESTISEFADAVDAIEEGSFSPPTPAKLRDKVYGNETFASRVCSNCDIRFSCESYREYVTGSRSRDLKKFQEIYEEQPSEDERDARFDAALP